MEELYSSDASGAAESGEEDNMKRERASSPEPERSSDQEDSAHESEDEDRKAQSQREVSADESDAEQSQRSSDEEQENQSESEGKGEKRKSASGSDSEHSEEEVRTKRKKMSTIQDNSGSEAELASNASDAGSDNEEQRDSDAKMSDDEGSPKGSDNEQQIDSDAKMSDEEGSPIGSDNEQQRDSDTKVSNDGGSPKGSDIEQQIDSDAKMSDEEGSPKGSDNERQIESDAKMSDEEGSPKGSDNEQQRDSDAKVSDEGGSPKVSDNEQQKDSDGKLSDAGGSPKATAEALFGDDISSEDEGGEKSAPVPNGVAEMASPKEMNEEQEEQEEPPLETRIEVEIPRISTNLGKEVHFIKLPNFLSVDTRPYDPQWYEDEIDEDEVLDEEGRARLKLKVENTIRWRKVYDDDGNAVNESNARVIKWSDGSLSLHLGSEIFDVYRQTLMSGDHNHLFIRQGTGLQGQAVFRTKLTFRPHSTDSFTHRKMTLSLADRNQKTQKIRVLPNVGKDPEAHRSEMIKQEEDRLKASIRRESKQRRMKEKSHSRGLSTSYLEPDRYEDEDDGAISLSAIKNKYKKGGATNKDRLIYSSDEGSDDESKAKRLEQAKEDDGDYDSDLDYFDRKKAAADGKKKAITLEDSDDDDE